jgi:NADH-quinone oxidoreductase subunit N
MEMEYVALAPEMSVLFGAVAALLGGSFAPRGRQWISRLIAAAALVGGAVMAVIGMAGPAGTVFQASFAVDASTGVSRLVICAATLLVIWLGSDELSGTPRESEVYALMLLSALGAMVMAGSSDLLVLAVGYLLASIPLYALVGMGRSPAAAEAALKTYLLGAFFGIALLMGVTILYGLAGATAYGRVGDALLDAPAGAIAAGLVGVLGGLAFKAGTVPGHFWVPDAAQGTSVAAAAFLTTVPKIGALVAAFRLLTVMPEAVNWPLLVAVFAAATMTLGNFAAFYQTDARRMLGWSTVSQAGYLLVPVTVAGTSGLALPSLLLYLGAYAVTNVAAFAVVAAAGHRALKDYGGLARDRPWLAAALLVSLLSLVGTPPTAVFVGKLTVFTAGWDGGFAWLVVVAALNTVASLFYYLRWIVPVFQRAVKNGTPASPLRRQVSPLRRQAGAAAGVAAGSVLALGVFAGLAWPLLDGPLAR